MGIAPLVVSVGTTHPWNIAGVGLDAHVARVFGCAHAAVVVAVSAQGASGVRALQPIDAELVRAQIAELPRPVAAVRVGALVAGATAAAVREALAEALAGIPMVVDPVMRATLGGSLCADPALLDGLRAFASLANVTVTPNLEEAQSLTALPAAHDEAGMAEAAGALLRAGFRAAVVTGGHLPGTPADVVADGRTVEFLRGTRLAGAMRGTGCVFAAAMACALAQGVGIADAARTAHAFVRARIAARIERGGLQVAF